MGPWNKKLINPARKRYSFASFSEQISGETTAEKLVQEYNSVI